METKEQKIEKKQEEIRELKYLKMDYERNIKDCEEQIKKAEQELKELENDTRNKGTED